MHKKCFQRNLPNVAWNVVFQVSWLTKVIIWPQFPKSRNALCSGDVWLHLASLEAYLKLFQHNLGCWQAQPKGIRIRQLLPKAGKEKRVYIYQTIIRHQIRNTSDGFLNLQSPQPPVLFIFGAKNKIWKLINFLLSSTLKVIYFLIKIPSNQLFC